MSKNNLVDIKREVARINDEDNAIREEILRRLKRSAEVIQSISKKVKQPATASVLEWQYENAYLKFTTLELLKIHPIFLTGSTWDVAKDTREILWIEKSKEKVREFCKEQDEIIQDALSTIKNNKAEIKYLESIIVSEELQRLKDENEMLTERRWKARANIDGTYGLAKLPAAEQKAKYRQMKAEMDAIRV